MTAHLGWIGIIAALCACHSFKSVEATAKLGQALGAQPIVVSEWIAECEAVHAAPTDPGLETICRDRDKRYETMVVAVRESSRLLQLYATTLIAAAQGKDVAVKDDLTAILAQMGTLNTDKVKTALPSVFNLADVVAKDSALVGKLTPSGAATIVDTVFRFASQSYRRDKIGEAVTTSAPHVDALVSFIEAEVQLHRADVASLRDAMASAVSARPLSNVTPVVGQMLPLVVAALDVRIDALARLDMACQAFRVAHAKLAERIRTDRPWKNDELLDELRRDVEAIARAFVK